MPVNHDFISEVSDVGIPPGWVKPSDWNFAHKLIGFLEKMDAIAVSPDVAPYLDEDGEGASYPISAFMRSLMNTASISALLGALNAAPLESPAFTGVPTAPTAATNNNTTQLATTAFVQAAIAALVASSPATLDTLNELATALGNDPNFATTMTNALALKAPLNSPALTGTPTAPTPTPGDNSTKLATTAFIAALIASYAPLASPALTGNPTAPTPASGDNDTSIATTAFVVAALNRAQAIANGTDFDTITTEGTYYNTGTCPNTPVAAGLFFLTVRKGNGTTNTSQQAIEATTGTAYVRVRSAGVWQPWTTVGFVVGQIPAGNNNTQPGAGKVGELATANNSLTFGASNSPQQITFITLQPGVWDVEYEATFGGAGVTTSSDWIAALSTNSASISTGVVHAWHERSPGGADVQRQACSPRARIAINVATTYYLNAQATFSGGSYGVGGTIYARRV